MNEEEKTLIEHIVLAYKDDEEDTHMVNVQGTFIQNKDIAYLLEKQQKEIERIAKKLKRYQKYLRDSEKKCDKLLEFEYTERERDYISKDKIKAKAQELDNQQRQWREDRTNKHTDAQIIYARDVLEELISETNEWR